MVSLEDAVIARLETGGNRFEILIDPNEAQAFKDGDEIDWEDSIAVDGIWTDSAKGERAPENILDDIFESSNLIDIYKRILTEGTIQLTSEQKKEMIDKKKKQILSHIVANAMNPQTGGAHPPQRIENAIVEAKNAPSEKLFIVFFIYLLQKTFLFLHEFIIKFVNINLYR